MEPLFTYVPGEGLCLCFLPELTSFLYASVGFLHVMIGWYLKIVDPVLARIWRVSTEKSTHEFINWEVKKNAWIREFHEKARA